MEDDLSHSPPSSEVNILRRRPNRDTSSSELLTNNGVKASDDVGLGDTTQKVSQHERIGTTDDGIVFNVPEMNDVFSSLAYTDNWGWPTAMLMSLATAQLVVALFWNLDVYQHGVIFLSW